MLAVYHVTLKHVSLDNVLYDRNKQKCDFMSAVCEGHYFNKSIHNVLMENLRIKILIQDIWPRIQHRSTSPNPSHTYYRCYDWFGRFAVTKKDLYPCFLN